MTEQLPNFCDAEGLDHLESLIHKYKAVAIDCTAKWCGPCKQIAPLFHQLAEQYPRIQFVRVDIDQCDDVASKYSISAIPRFLFFFKREPFAEIEGANPAELQSTVESLFQAM